MEQVGRDVHPDLCSAAHHAVITIDVRRASIRTARTRCAMKFQAGTGIDTSRRELSVPEQHGTKHHDRRFKPDSVGDGRRIWDIERAKLIECGCVWVRNSRVSGSRGDTMVWSPGCNDQLTVRAAGAPCDIPWCPSPPHSKETPDDRLRRPRAGQFLSHCPREHDSDRGRHSRIQVRLRRRARHAVRRGNAQAHRVWPDGLRGDEQAGQRDHAERL